jgi:hypothetical protein
MSAAASTWMERLRAASATNLLLLGFDTHALDAKALPEDAMNAPLDCKRFEVGICI